MPLSRISCPKGVPRLTSSHTVRKSHAVTPRYSRLANSDTGTMVYECALGRTIPYPHQSCPELLPTDLGFQQRLIPNADKFAATEDVTVSRCTNRIWDQFQPRLRATDANCRSDAHLVIDSCLQGAERSAAGAGRAEAAAAAKAEREDSAEVREMTFRPKICRKSVAIAKTMGRDGTKVVLDLSWNATESGARVPPRVFSSSCFSFLSPPMLTMCSLFVPPTAV